MGLLQPATASYAAPPFVSGGWAVRAVVQIETNPVFAGDKVTVSSSQLQSTCGGTISFETL